MVWLWVSSVDRSTFFFLFFHLPFGFLMSVQNILINLTGAQHVLCAFFYVLLLPKKNKTSHSHCNQSTTFPILTCWNRGVAFMGPKVLSWKAFVKWNGEARCLGMSLCNSSMYGECIIGLLWFMRSPTKPSATRWVASSHTAWLRMGISSTNQLCTKLSL